MTGESNSVVHLCVAVRRKLQLYYGKNGEFKKHLFDFTIPDVPKVMAWGQQYLCVGFKADYTFYDVSMKSLIRGAHGTHTIISAISRVFRYIGFDYSEFADTPKLSVCRATDNIM